MEGNDGEVKATRRRGENEKVSPLARIIVAATST